MHVSHSLMPRPLSFFCVGVGKERVWWISVCGLVQLRAPKSGSYLIYRIYGHCTVSEQYKYTYLFIMVCTEPHIRVCVYVHVIII